MSTSQRRGPRPSTPRRSRGSPRSARSGRPRTRGTPATPIAWRWPTPRTRSGGTGASSSVGRDQIRRFLAGKWDRELDYRLVKDLWAFTADRIAVRFQYEWHDADGHWYRSYGNELWEFDERGLMRRREASINDVRSPRPTASSSGPRPAPGRRTTPASRTSGNPGFGRTPAVENSPRPGTIPPLIQYFLRVVMTG